MAHSQVFLFKKKKASEAFWEVLKSRGQTGGRQQSSQDIAQCSGRRQGFDIAGGHAEGGSWESRNKGGTFGFNWREKYGTKVKGEDMVKILNVKRRDKTD